MFFLSRIGGVMVNVLVGKIVSSIPVFGQSKELKIGIVASPLSTHH
jgi:hypothetical protein